MKFYNFALPILLSFFLINPDHSTYNAISESGQLESQTHLLDQTWPKKGKKQGPLIANQDFSNCNTCGNCMPSCTQSDDACAGAIVSINTIDCEQVSPKGSISFPGNNQFVCSITTIGPYTWYVEFNVIAYSCAFPDTPFTFDVPVQLEWVCPGTANNVTTTNLNFLIC